MAFYAAAARQAASRMVSDTQIDHTTNSVTNALKKRRAANESERNVVFGVHPPTPILNPDEVFLFTDDQDAAIQNQAVESDQYDSFDEVRREQLHKLDDLRKELEDLDEHRTEEDIEQEIADGEEDLDTKQRHVEVRDRFKARQERRRTLAKKMFELQANLEAQGIIRDLMNPHAKSIQKDQPTTSVLTAITSLVIDQSYEQVCRRKNWIIGIVAIIQCFLIVLMLQIPWEGEDIWQYDNDHPAIAVIEVLQSVLTAIMLILLVDYYRHLAKWEAVKMNLPPEVASLRRYSRLPFLFVELLICVIHPFPYLYVRKLSLLVFFRLYVLIRVYRDESKVYKWRREIQSQESVKSKIAFDSWFSVRTLFYREPWFALIIVTVLTVCFFAYCLYINERELVNSVTKVKGYINAGCTVTCPPSGTVTIDGSPSPCIAQTEVILPNCPSTGNYAEYRSCFYFVALTMTTIGIGEQVAMSNWGRIFLMVAALFGMAIAGILLTAIIRVITLNYAQKYAADFCALKHLALQEQHLAARVIQQFFRENLRNGQLRRMALRNRATLAQTRRGPLGMGLATTGSIATSTAAAAAAATALASGTANGMNASSTAAASSAPGASGNGDANKKKTMRSIAAEVEESQSCCAHNEFEVRIEQFKRYRLTAAQQIGQEDGTQIKHMFAMRTFAGNTAMAVEDITSKQVQMTNHVQRMASALLSTIQAFTMKTVESMRRSGAAKKVDIGNTQLTLTQHALRGAFATSLANNRVSGLGLAPLPNAPASPKVSTGPLVKDESMGVFYVFS